MILNRDLFNILIKYCRLPPASVSDSMDALNELKELKDEIEELKVKMGCTRVKHGEKSVCQDTFRCLTCHPVGDKRICKACFEFCHKEHDASLLKVTPGISDDTKIGRRWGTLKKFYSSQDGKNFNDFYDQTADEDAYCITSFEEFKGANRRLIESKFYIDFDNHGLSNNEIEARKKQGRNYLSSIHEKETKALLN